MLSVDEWRALLAPVYVHDDEHLDQQCARYAEAARTFARVFGCEPTVFYRAPGRVNLIGEHTDYNQGFVMPTAIDRDIVIAGRPRDDSLLRAANVERERYEDFQFRIARDIPSGPVGHWSNYLRGAAQRLAQATPGPLRGMDAVVSGRPPHGTPIGVGLSSSTSLTVAATLALSHLNSLMPDGQALAELASEAEWYVGTRGGIMDHFASVLGRGGHALFLDCRPQGRGHYRLELIPLPADYRLVVCSTGVRHENTRSEFNTRVFECRVGAHIIGRRYPQVRYLRDVSEEGLGLSSSEVDALLEEMLPVGIAGRDLIASGVAEVVAADMPPSFRIDPERTYLVRQRCRHVVRENRRVLDSAAALRSGDVRRFGRLMDEAHSSARDDYQVSVPQVEAMVEAARRAPGCLGARITGAGWGGCVVALVGAAAVDEFASAVREQYLAATGIRPEVIVCNSATGAQAITIR
ncbi:MAG: galactokinase [Anaerolineae bacterium]|nr:galactokinase [Anaerolineae bacterium]